MYNKFTEEMADKVAVFGRATMSETPASFTDDAGIVAALESCLSETVTALAEARDMSKQSDLRCIYAGLDCLIRLFEEMN